MALVVKNAPANAGDIRGGVRDTGLIPGLGRYPGYTLVLLPGESHGQRILWTEEPGRLWSTEWHRVRHDRSDLAHMYAIALNLLLFIFPAGKHNRI